MVSAVSKEIVPVASSSTVDQPTSTCVVKDETNIDWQNSRRAFSLPASTSVDDFCVHVAKEFGYEDESFILVWMKISQTPGTGEIEVNLNKMRKESQTLADLGLNTNGKKNNFLIKEKDNVAPRKLKEAAEDIAEDSVSNMFQPSSNSTTSSYGSSSYYSNDAYTLSKSDTGFVGLVNQAMTCYLNSLLQTLFMTPEFRNAMYRWEFKDLEGEAAKSIPYQLQRLFLKLQTSNKRAVETTDVTKSFGWDSSEAWQQHDVQELCRVMFDALEFNFKSTDQNDLINKLYQGKLKDYVKCLECGSENARSDTYLDIPLAIKPFGSQVAFGSVEEALEGFVMPETLNEGNQYFCEKCNKKCDAHKGLKFISFPYLLTLQLKRFAFDFATLHRIKLNDRMTFPKYLNLSKFVSDDHSENSNAELNNQEDSANGTETDSGVSEGCSDNGVSTEDGETGRGACAAGCVGTFVPDDLDSALSSGKGTSGPEGPHVYELFSIMIHSGSASGGHYYAYIKSFANNLWYCFNDQSVTRVYDDDIERTFGGSESLRSYYSPAYSSSTNAYMLMYRQVCKERNIGFMDVNRMPEHILDLINAMKNQDEADKRRRELDKSTCKIKVFCEYPVQRKMLERRLEIHKDCTLQEAVIESHRLFGLEGIVPAERCRLVKYDEYYDTIERSYHNEEQSAIGKVLCGVKSSYIFDLLLEIRRADEEFPVYKPGGTTVKALLVDLETGDVHPPVTVRTCVSATVKDLKKLIHEKLHVPLETLRTVLENSYSELRLLENPNKTLKDLGFFKSTKVFVEASGTEEDKDVLFDDSKLCQVLDVYQHSVDIIVSLPDPRLKPPDESSMHVVSDEIEDSSDTGPEQETTVRIDKRISLGDFKRILEPKVGCPAELFRVYRVYSNNQETEYSKLGDPMSSFTDDSRVRIKYGRALKKGEWRLSVCMLRPNEKEVFKSLFDLIVSSGMSVRECKELLQPELAHRLGIDIPVENLRIRKKTWRNPSTVFVDTQTFDHDITVYTSFEICVEHLEGPESKTSLHHVSLYLRRWSPSSLQLGSLKEVVLTERTVDCLKNEISRASGIPLENVEFTKGRGQFPSTVSVLDIHDMDWHREGVTIGVSPLYICDDGVVIYYRDSTESLVEISEERRQDIIKKENAKSSGASSTRIGGFSYKEKALKIYTDGKPGTKT